MKKMGLQNHWWMANSGVGIMLRDLTLAEIRLNTLIGRRRGWHYNRGQYSGGALYIYFNHKFNMVSILLILEKYS